MLESPSGDSNQWEIAAKSLIVELRTLGGINSFSSTLESIFFVPVSGRDNNSSHR